MICSAAIGVWYIACHVKANVEIGNGVAAIAEYPIELMMQASHTCDPSLSPTCLTTAQEVIEHDDWIAIWVVLKPALEVAVRADPVHATIPWTPIRWRVAHSKNAEMNDWKEKLVYNPRKPNHCFWQCVLFSVFDEATADDDRAMRWLRRLVARSASLPAYSHALQGVAEQSGLSPQCYVKQLRKSMWGGAFEAAILADVLQCSISAQSVDGRRLYEYGQGKRCTLGLHRSHYVVIRDHGDETRCSGDDDGQRLFRGGMLGDLGYVGVNTPVPRWRMVRMRLPAQDIQSEMTFATPDVCRVSYLRDRVARWAGVDAWHIELTPPDGRRLADWQVLQDEVLFYGAISEGDSDSESSEEGAYGRWQRCVMASDLPLRGRRRDLALLVYHMDGTIEAILLTMPDPHPRPQTVRQWLARRIGCEEHLLAISQCAPHQAMWYGTWTLFVAYALPPSVHLERDLLRGGVLRDMSVQDLQEGIRSNHPDLYRGNIVQ